MYLEKQSIFRKLNHKLKTAMQTVRLHGSDLQETQRYSMLETASLERMTMNWVWPFW